MIELKKHLMQLKAEMPDIQHFYTPYHLSTEAGNEMLLITGPSYSLALIGCPHKKPYLWRAPQLDDATFKTLFDVFLKSIVIKMGAHFMEVFQC